MSPEPQPSHSAWQHAARRLFAKMLAEFAYEEVITPEPDGTAPDGTPQYRLPITDDLVYRFRARRGAYGHWRVDPDSITPDTDPFRFLTHAHDTVLGLSGDTTGHLIRELTATLAADTRLDATALSAADLADLGLRRPRRPPDRPPLARREQGPARLLRP